MTTTSVTSGVTSSGFTVTSGNELDVFSEVITGSTVLVGGVTTPTDFMLPSDSTSDTIVASGQTVSNVTVFSGASQTIDHGGTAINTTVNSGGTQVDYGLAKGITVIGGNEYVSSGGVAQNVVPDVWGLWRHSKTRSNQRPYSFRVRLRCCFSRWLGQRRADRRRPECGWIGFRRYG